MAAVHEERGGTPVAERSCRVHWFTGRVHEVLDEVTAGGTHVSSLNPDEIAESLQELCRAQSRMDALKAALLAQGERVGVAEECGATSTAAWLVGSTRTVRARAVAQVRLAASLVSGAFDATVAAFDDGAVDADQAMVITQAVANLPAFVGPDDRRRAELHLLDEATRHDAKSLKLLARHLLHVIDPAAADEELAKQLEREEALAARRTVFTMFDDGKGTCHGRFKIPSVEGAMLATALNALTSPTRPDAIAREVPDPDDPDGPMVQRAAPDILGQAFVELIHRYPTTKLPKVGGGLATVLVMIPLEVLEGRLGVATLSTGGHLTAGATRRLACHHGLIAGVFGAKSEPLDLSRRVRLHTESQRVAMAVRDKTCTAEGCSVPATWCHAHHRVSWADGGRTSVADGRMVCPRHHRMIHGPRHLAEYLPNGRIRLTKRHRQ